VSALIGPSRLSTVSPRHATIPQANRSVPTGAALREWQFPTRAAGVTASTAPAQGAGAGSIPSAALQNLRVRPIPFRVAKAMLVRDHYLHSLPGGTHLVFGMFLGHRLLGALTFGAGPANVHRLVEGARREDCLTLTRLWLDDALPPNAESRVIGITLRGLRRHTDVRFVATYADPAVGHLGTIYQASNWLYVGESQAMALLDLGDGVLQHSRSLAHVYGTHSRAHFAAHSVEMRAVPQSPKHRYIYFLDPAWRPRLRVPALPYPKKEELDGRR